MLSSLVRLFLSNPLVSLCVELGALIFAGTLLLSSQGIAGIPVPFIDAIFLVVSALTGTGLSTFDISTLSFGGQLIIAICVQAGMIGATMAGLIFFALMRARPALSAEKGAQSAFGIDVLAETMAALRFTGIFLFITELLATVSLFFLLPADVQGWTRLWYAFFHALNAFANSGFALWSESVAGFSLWGIMALAFWIILGGMGILVARNVWLFFRSNASLTLTTRVTLWMTLAMLACGTGALWIFERSGGVSITDAFFWTVTSRTAGFAASSVADLTNASWATLIALMSVGGGPISFTGGIRVTAFFIILFVVWKSLFSYSLRPVLWRRKIPVIAVRRAIVTVGLFGIIGGGLLIAFLHASAFPIQESIFEFVSALTTTGLSMGITSSLSWEGKSILVLAMLWGRVVPLIAAYAVGRLHERHYVDYLEEDIGIG